MSGPALTPWSVVDDADDAASPDVRADDRAPHGEPPRAEPASHAVAPPRARWAVIGPRSALAPIVTALALEGWHLFHRGNPTDVTAVSLIQLICIGLAGGMLLYGLASQRRQLRSMLAMTRGGAGFQDRPDAASGLPHLTRDLREFQMTLTDHLNRLSDGLARGRDEGLSLGYRLASSEQRHQRAVLDGLSKAILVFDAAERLLYANPAAGALLGFAFDAANKRTLQETVADPALAQHIRQMQRAPLKTRRQIEWALGERSFDITLRRLPEADHGETGAAEGEAAGFVVAVLHDATREREASKVMSEFVSHVSHELRTPLSSLKAYAEMLMSGEAEDEQTRREYCGIIEAETDRMARLIDEILNISRIESGVVKVSKEPVALALVVREVVDVMKPQAERKQIKLLDELSPVAHEVLADRDMMKQAVLNLTSNAIKYTPDGGRVRVVMRVNEGERTLTVEVSDTGLGIPEADLPRVFEKFYRVKANSKIAKGTGLGLNLVKNIVETVHGGKVAVQSKVGAGSTFSVTLPLV